MRSLPLGSFSLAVILGIGPNGNSIMKDFILCSAILTQPLTHMKNPTASFTVLCLSEPTHLARVFHTILQAPSFFWVPFLPLPLTALTPT